MPETATPIIGKILARPRLIYAAAVGLFLADRGLKMIVTRPALRPLGGRLMSFDLFLNRGIAFSLPLPGPIFWTLTTLAFAALIWALIAALREARYHRFLPLLILVLLGALSNLWDRLTVGATVDYLIFLRTSAVNLADAMIVAGLAMVLLTAREDKRRQK
jgi:lipoprotein signal peptidase